MTRTIRAILIDPEKRAFTEIQVEDDYRKTMQVLGCCRFTGAGDSLNRRPDGSYDAIYVSDDGLEERDDPRFWFQVDADRNPPSSCPVAGLGLALGFCECGKGRDVSIGVDELAARITFTQRKFRGFKAWENDVQVIGIKRPVIAPVIDGTDGQ